MWALGEGSQEWRKLSLKGELLLGLWAIAVDGEQGQDEARPQVTESRVLFIFSNLHSAGPPKTLNTY